MVEKKDFKHRNPEADWDLFIVTEVQNRQELVDELKKTAPEPSSFLDFSVSENLDLLVRLTKKTGKKLFAVKTAVGTWTIIADSVTDILALKSEINAVAQLQSHIDPKELQGMCMYLHEYACQQGISDGCFVTTEVSTGESVYNIRGFHYIGYKDDQPTGKTLIFDITSKDYVFTPQCTTIPAVCEGIMVLEEKGETKAIETLYSTTWNRKPFGKPRIKPI